jgi:hypothetical protein
MKPQTLASAFQAALNRNRSQPQSAAALPDLPLLVALERSATGRDQIVQRRIGLIRQAAEAA